MQAELITLIQQNRMREAQALCAKLCKAQPNNAQLNFMMSAICGQLGDYPKSEKYSQKAIKLQPGVAEAHFNLGIARLRQGKPLPAIDSFKQAIKLNPALAAAHNELGNAWQHANDLPQAVNSYRQALTLQPRYAEAACNLGAALHKIGDAEAAIKHYQSALAINPALQTAQLALGELLLSRDRAGALRHCQAALTTAADNAETYSRLASLCKKLGLLEACLDCYEKALQLQPQDARLLSNSGIALKEAGRLDDAIDRHQRAISLAPKLAETHYNLGSALTAAAREHEAEAAYRRAIDLNPNFVEALTNLGTLLLLQGRVEEGLPYLESALANDADYSLAASNRLLAMNYLAEISAETVFHAHRDWGNRFSASCTAGAYAYHARSPGAPLRIGFVSPDFRSHSVAFFFATLLGHGRPDIEIHCYSNTLRRDATTERIRAGAAGWRDIVALSDAEAAALIHQDRIDILLDLTGHTADHRLGVFALRPAPLQMTWLGYPNTTGLAAIDYRITDALADPDGAEALHTEKLLRLPRCFLCYAPPQDAPEPTLPGTDRSRPLSFGSFNNLAKIGPDLVRCWAEILRQTPGSRLVIKNRPLGDPAVAERYRALFAAHGIGPERLELLAWLPGIDSHLAAYNLIDIALDTYPYHGTTTTCEALWMNRPVVTRRGDRHAARVGLSLLHSLGLDELVAQDEASYIDTAVRLAQQLEDFTSRQGDIRERMQRSALCDAADFQTAFFSLLLSAHDATPR